MLLYDIACMWLRNIWLKKWSGRPILKVSTGMYSVHMNENVGFVHPSVRTNDHPDIRNKCPNMRIRVSDIYPSVRKIARVFGHLYEYPKEHLTETYVHTKHSSDRRTMFWPLALSILRLCHQTNHLKCLYFNLKEFHIFIEVA